VKRPDEGEVAVALGVIEAVTDNEKIGNLESDVMGPDDFLSASGLFEENANPEAPGAGGTKPGHDSFEGLAGVEDVVDDEDVAATEIEPHFLGEDEFAGLGFRAIAGDAKEIQFDWQGKVAEQIGEEEDRTVEEGDDDEFGAGGIALDLAREMANAGGDLGAGEQNAGDVVPPAARDGSRPGGSEPVGAAFSCCWSHAHVWPCTRMPGRFRRVDRVIPSHYHFEPAGLKQA
jgi:hypothetical protein